MKEQLDNPKYTAIVNKGKALFWKHGIKRVSIEEICSEANVSKVTFYKFFSNKLEFAKHLLITILDVSLEKFKNVVDSDLAFTEKVEELFFIKMEAARGFSIEFLNDVYKFPESGIPQLMEEKGQISFKIFVDFLKDSQQKGLIRKDIKIEFIMHYLDMSFQIFDNKALVEKYKEPHDLVMESMKLLFYGIVKHD